MSSDAIAYNKLDNAQKDFFNEVQKAAFSEQACAFLDAYWNDIGGQADFIFNVAWEVMKEVDMQMQNCIYMHLYKESNALKDFDWAMLFFERLCKAVETRETEEKSSAGETVLKNGKPVMKKWAEIPYYSISMPTMMTAVTRKQELKEKVDFNKDNTISFIEYLIYQYKNVSNAADFIVKGRAIKEGSRMDSPERKQLQLAEQALEEVRAKIAAYQAAMSAQQLIIDDPSIGRARKGKATFELEELKNSGLANELKKALIDAEYKVKVAMKMIQDALAKAAAGSGVEIAKGVNLNPGKMFWVEASVKAEKKRAAGYGIKGLVAKN